MVRRNTQIWGSRAFNHHGQWLKIQGWHAYLWPYLLARKPTTRFFIPTPRKTPWFTWDLNDIRSNHLPVEDKKTPYFHFVRLQILGFSLKLTFLAPFKKDGTGNTMGVGDPQYPIPSEVGGPRDFPHPMAPSLGECSQSGDGGGEPTIFKAWINPRERWCVVCIWCMCGAIGCFRKISHWFRI